MEHSWRIRELGAGVLLPGIALVKLSDALHSEATALQAEHPVTSESVRRIHERAPRPRAAL